MAESTLAVTKSDLDREIARYLGYDTDEGNQSVQEASDIENCRNSGLSRFYAERDWVFLYPWTTLDTVIDDWEYNLPDSFGSLCDTFYFDDDEAYAPIEIVSDQYIYRQRAQSTTSGIPRYAAVSVQDPDGETERGQRFALLVYPVPDAAYTLHYQYAILMNALTGTKPYPAGGALHRNTMISACLAEAQRMFDDELGIHEAAYQRFLEGSFRVDDRLRPRNLGYCSDNTSKSGPNQKVRYCRYDGVLPD